MARILQNYVLRETAAQFDKPALLFSGGKDSIVMAHLARKAFHPARLPFPLLHVDTGHNFPETISYRDEYVDLLKADLIVALVQDSIDKGTAIEEKGAFGVWGGGAGLGGETIAAMSCRP